MYPHEKEQLEKEAYEQARNLEARREIEAKERQEKTDREKRIKEQKKATEEYWKKKEFEYKQAIKDEEKQKNKQMYDFEQREKDRLARPAWKSKRKELTGKEAGAMVLQRQRETEILSEALIKQETEKTELWRESERIRRGLPKKEPETEKTNSKNYSKKWIDFLNGIKD